MRLSEAENSNTRNIDSKIAYECGKMQSSRSKTALYFHSSSGIYEPFTMKLNCFFCLTRFLIHSQLNIRLVICCSLVFITRRKEKINSHSVAREQNGNNIKKIIYWMHIKCQHWRQKDDADDDDDYDQNQCQYFESQIHIVFCFELNMSPFNWLLS